MKMFVLLGDVVVLAILASIAKGGLLMDDGDPLSGTTY